MISLSIQSERTSKVGLGESKLSVVIEKPRINLAGAALAGVIAVSALTSSTGAVTPNPLAASHVHVSTNGSNLTGSSSSRKVSLFDQRQFKYVAPKTAETNRPTLIKSDHRSTAERIKDVRQATDLTWEQLAKMFGVSRRSVHLWASTGKMNANNEEVLGRIERVVNGLKNMTPQQRRSAFLDSSNGQSILARIKSERSENQIVEYAAYTAAELLGA